MGLSRIQHLNLNELPEQLRAEINKYAKMVDMDNPEITNRKLKRLVIKKFKKQIERHLKK